MPDFEAELRNSLKDLNTRVNSLGNGLTTVKTTTNEVGTAMKHHFGESERAAKAASHEVFEVGHALKGLGGPLGEIAHAGTNVFRFEGGLARVALAATAAGLAIEFVKSRLEEMQKEELATIAMTRKLGDALYEAGKQGAAAQLKRGEGQGDDTRLLAARLGPNGIKQAQAIANTGATTLQDATKGLSQAALIKDPTARGNAIQAAMYAAAIGEGTFSGHMADIAKDKAMQNRFGSASRKSDLMDLTSRLITNNQGVLPTAANRADALAELNGPGRAAIDQVNTLTAYGNSVSIADQNALVSGGLQKAKMNETLNANDPNREVRQKFDIEQGAKLQELIDIQRTSYGQFNDTLRQLLNVWTLSGDAMNEGTNIGAVRRQRENMRRAKEANGFGDN